jgi:hypothetical protein
MTEAEAIFRALSYVQHQTIRDLLNPKHYASRRSCTNATLCALEKRGLVTWRFITIPTEFGPCRTEKWSLTALGRKVAQL